MHTPETHPEDGFTPTSFKVLLQMMHKDVHPFFDPLAVHLGYIAASGSAFETALIPPVPLAYLSAVSTGLALHRPLNRRLTAGLVWRLGTSIGLGSLATGL
jgi:hypothetical protein